MNIERYVNDIDLAKSLFHRLDVTAATRADYQYRIGAFLGFIKDRTFDYDTYLEYKRQLGDRRDISVSTKNKLLVSARIWLKELHRRGEIPVDVTSGVKVFRQTKKHKKMGITEEEMAVLTEHMRGLVPNPANSRLRAILALLALQGLREREVINLDCQDYDRASSVLWIWGKGRDDKEPIDMNPETVKALEEHLSVNNIKDGAIFASMSNNRGNNRLTTKSIREIVTGKLKELGVTKSTHSFRHYFCTMLIKAYRGDLLEVMRHTRHQSLEMLQVYNDMVNAQADLPRFFKAFEGVSF